MTDAILLVGADAEMVRAVTAALAERDFTVRVAATAEAAFDVLAARPVAGVVLVSAGSADETLATLERLRARVGGAWIVLVPERPTIDLAVRAVKAGAFHVVDARGDVASAVAAQVGDAAASAARVRRSGLVRPVLVGRERERGLLAAELDRACAGEGRVLLLTGDNGVGKTSLALELARAARERGALVLSGRCDDGPGAPAYWPWRQLLGAYVGVAGAAAVREQLGPDAAILAALVPALRGAVGPVAAGADVSRYSVGAGVAQLLRRAAARRPLVCVLDDLHQADRDSLHLVYTLTGQLADCRVLLVGTARDALIDATARDELRRIADQPVTTTVRLGGFGEDEVARYIVAATDVRPPAALVGAIVEKTGGNPLFVTDIVSLLAADGRLEGDPGPGGFRIAIPESRRQAIADRIGRLSAACERLLGAAAVVGSEFELDVLAQVADCDVDAARAALDEATAHRFVVQGDAPSAFRFSHGLVRDVLYDRLPATARPHLHARAADALEAVPAGRGDRPLAAIAHHRLEAATCPDDVARAYRYVVAAAHRAAELMAHDEAARYFEIALGVAERAGLATPSVRTELLVELAETRWRAGHTEAARDAGRRALAVAKATVEPGAVAAAALAFAGRLPGFGAIACDEEVVAELEAALAGLPPTATALRALVMARLAEELTYLPSRSADRTLAPKAIALARGLDDPAVLAGVLRTTQWSVWTPDDVERRRQLAEEIVALALRMKDPLLQLDGELFRLWSALEHGKLDVAVTQLDVARRLGRSLRLPYYDWMLTMAEGCLALARGRLDDAERIAGEALRAGDATANPTIPLFAGALRGHILWHRGRFDELARWLTDVVGSFPMLAATLDCSLVITHAQAGQHELARTLLARFAADDFADVPRNPMWLMNMLSLADGCLALGDADAAERLYLQLEPFARVNCVVVPVWVGQPVALYMGGLAALLGDTVAARRHYEHALYLGARTGTRQWTARTQLAYARLLAASDRPGDADRARELVAAAREIAGELGLAPVLRLIDEQSASRRRAPRVCRFERVDDVWHVELDGRRATVEHMTGMPYLRYLLERPDHDVSVLELVSGGGPVLVESSGGPILDLRAARDLRARIAEIDAEVEALEAARAAPDPALRREREQCEEHLDLEQQAFMHAAKRARTPVRKAIIRAIDAIERRHDALGQHLRRHVRTGTFCRYVADVAAPLELVY